MSTMNQRDIYPEEMLNFIFPFNFTGTEDIDKNFNRMGLEGTNFIETTGSLLFTLAMMIISSFFMNLVHKLCVIYYKHWIARTIGMNINVSETIGAGI